MVTQEPWQSLGRDYLDPLPFDRVIESYQAICRDFGFNDIIINPVVSPPKSVKSSPNPRLIADLEETKLALEKEELSKAAAESHSDDGISKPKAEKLKSGVKQSIDLEEYELWAKKMEKRKLQDDSKKHHEM